MKDQNENLKYTANTYLNKAQNYSDASGKEARKYTPVWLKVLAVVLLVSLVVGAVWVGYKLEDYYKNSTNPIQCKGCGKMYPKISDNTPYKKDGYCLACSQGPIYPFYP